MEELVVADPGAPGALDAALADHDAVISTVGPTGRGPSTACTDVVTSTLGSMARTGVRRLVVVSAHGVGDSRDRSPYCLGVWALVGAKMRDKESMESALRASDCDWTIVRPPALTDRDATGAYRSSEDLRIGLTSALPRADLADFLLHEVGARTYVHRAPRITA
ncbi:SDR family oxidoreductase [Kineococcus sp. NUM-3379]